MGRYIRKLTRLGSLGPAEERGFGLWAAYDIVGVEDDRTAEGLIRVDGWTTERLAEYGVTTFVTVEPERLGIERSA